MKNLTPIFVLVLILIISCKKEIKTLDFKTFTIDVPSNWVAIKEKGIDSYTGRIAVDRTDTISFDLGWYSSNLEEEFLLDEDTVRLGKNLKNNRSIEIVNNKRAIIIRPKKSGFGTTGIYINSVWTAGSGVDKFQLNGCNLKPENEKLLLKAISTIKFHPK